MTSHLEAGILHELLDGEIPSAELAPIQAHLAGCAECRARLEEARGFQSVSDQLIEVLDQPVAAPRRPAATPVMLYRYSWKRNIAWAATIIAAVGIGFYGGRGSGGAQPTDARLTVPAAAPAASKVLADRPAERDAAQEKKEALGKAKASANESARLDQVREPVESEPRVQALGAAPAAAPQAAGAAAQPPAATPSPERRAAAIPAERPVTILDYAPAPSLKELASSRVAPLPGSLARVAPQPERIEFSEAVRRLGGSLRLIDGLVPDRLEALGQEVRVVYPLASGELFLRQQLIDGRITFRLTAPAGFPADSLERLKARIRE